LGRLLEKVNVKLGSVISDIVGMSGMAILEAMAAGKTDPEKLALPRFWCNSRRPQR
jgi:transposase